MVGDQAENLRQFVNETRDKGRVLAIASGKGGVGKTNLTVNLAIALAARKKRVVVLDADLGLANVEVLLGLNSLYNLQHVVSGEKTMADVMVQGPGGIWLVPGSSGIARIADLDLSARQNVLANLRDLQHKSDFIMIDTMAGIGRNAVAFPAAADEVLLVATPEPSSIVDAYAAVKTIYRLREDAVFRLVVNLAVNGSQARAVAQKLSSVIQRYQSQTLSYLGHIPRDPHVQRGVMQTYPFALSFPNAPAAKAIEEIAARLLQHETDDLRPGFFQRFAQTLRLVSNA
jgi:flagellar biosynthesis protein FlhG